MRLKCFLDMNQQEPWVDISSSIGIEALSFALSGHWMPCIPISLGFSQGQDGLGVADAAAQVSLLVQCYKYAPLLLEYGGQAPRLDYLPVLGVGSEGLPGQTHRQPPLFQCQHKNICRPGNY